MDLRSDSYITIKEDTRLEFCRDVFPDPGYWSFLAYFLTLYVSAVSVAGELLDPADDLGHPCIDARLVEVGAPGAAAHGADQVRPGGGTRNGAGSARR